MPEQHEMHIGSRFEMRIRLHFLVRYGGDGIISDIADKKTRAPELFHLLQGLGDLCLLQGFDHKNRSFINIIAENECRHNRDPLCAQK